MSKKAKKKFFCYVFLSTAIDTFYEKSLKNKQIKAHYTVETNLF